MSYLSDEQVQQLLAPINKNRVSQKDGQAHVEAYEVRAMLTRIFGFGRWSEDTVDLTMLYEQSKPSDDNKTLRWRAAYRATVCLTVRAPDGTVLATYTESAVGTNFGWLPDSKRDETHDMAIKTAASQALKRCAMNLGDQFGLSLYRKGSTAPLIHTVIAPTRASIGTREEREQSDVTAHITEQLPREDEATGATEVGEASQTQVNTPPPSEGNDQAVGGHDRTGEIEALRARVLAEPKGKIQLHYARLQAEAAKAGLLKTVVADGNGEAVTLKRLIDMQLEAHTPVPEPVVSGRDRAAGVG